MERLLQLGASPDSWPRDQAALRAQARQIVQDIRTIFPIDQYVSPPRAHRSASPGPSVFKDPQADWVLLYSVALKKLVSELPSMSEKELSEAGELGASATLIC
jgi:hypothetical protein